MLHCTLSNEVVNKSSKLASISSSATRDGRSMFSMGVSGQSSGSLQVDCERIVRVRKSWFFAREFVFDARALCDSRRISWPRHKYPSLAAGFNPIDIFAAQDNGSLSTDQIGEQKAYQNLRP